VRAAAGRVFVFGHDAVGDLAARLLVGVAPQEVHLDRFLTAHDVAAGSCDHAPLGASG
jgi:hypothetical protein